MPGQSLSALLALKSDSVTVLNQVVVYVFDFDYSCAIKCWTLNSVSSAGHSMVHFLSQLEVLVAHLTLKLNLKQLLCNETVHLHIVVDTHAACRAVLGLLLPSGDTCLTE